MNEIKITIEMSIEVAFERFPFLKELADSLYARFSEIYGEDSDVERIIQGLVVKSLFHLLSSPLDEDRKHEA